MDQGAAPSGACLRGLRSSQLRRTAPGRGIYLDLVRPSGRDLDRPVGRQLVADRVVWHLQQPVGRASTRKAVSRRPQRDLRRRHSQHRQRPLRRTGRDGVLCLPGDEHHQPQRSHRTVHHVPRCEDLPPGRDGKGGLPGAGVQGRDHERVGQADRRHLRHRLLREHTVEHQVQRAAAALPLPLPSQLARQAEQAQRPRNLLRRCRHAAQRRVGLGRMPEGRAARSKPRVYGTSSTMEPGSRTTTSQPRATRPTASPSHGADCYFQQTSGARTVGGTLVRRRSGPGRSPRRPCEDSSFPAARDREAPPC
jgi:hypothetical protein